MRCTTRALKDVVILLVLMLLVLLLIILLPDLVLFLLQWLMPNYV